MDLKKLKAAFQTAWADTKKGLSAIDSYLQTHGPAIQADIAVGEAVAVKLAPQLAPVVAGIAAIEPIIASEVMAVIHAGAGIVNADSNSATITLSLSLYRAVQALVGTMSNHPAVIEASK